MKKRYPVAAALAALALTLTGCSSGGDSPASTDGSGGSDTIKLMVMGPIDSPLVSLPTIPGGAQAAVDQVNDEGGINGKQLELLVCDDQMDPNIAIGCARTAIEEGVVAFVGGFTLNDAQVVPLLAGANIPLVGLNSSNEAATDNAFLIGGEGVISGIGVAVALADAGCTSIASVHDAASPPLDSVAYEAGTEASGIEYLGRFQIAQNSSDWAPTVAAALATHPDCIASTVGPTSAGAFVTAVRAADPDIPIGFISGGLPDAVVEQLGATADGIIGIGGFYPISADEGDVPALRDQLAISVPDETSFDNFTMSGYAAVKIVAEALKSMGDEEITAPNVLAALPNVKDFDTGVGPVVDFSTPNPVPGYERRFNLELIRLDAENGALVLKDTTRIDASDALAILSEQQQK